MGYGGALIYSGLAYNLKKRFPRKKVVFVYSWNVDELLWRRGAADRVMWEHNSDIDLVIDRLRWFIWRWQYPKQATTVVHLDDPRTFYWLKDYGDRIKYKSGQHAIRIACEAFGLEGCDLRSRIVLTNEEITAVEALLHKHRLRAKQYICIEPHTKDTWTPNKSWFFERWQEVVDRLQHYFKERKRDITIAQVGVPHSPVLKNVVNLTGQATLRETGEVLKRSILLASAEGGLPHLAAAVGATAVVLMSNMLPPELMAYPQHINLYADQNCSCRGLKTPCPRRRACMKKITVNDVFKAVLEMLSKGHFSG